MHIPQTDVILRHEGTELARVTLPPGEYVIGRNPDSDIFANTPLISRQHARLTINYDYLVLEDLGSSNGTYINDKPVKDATRLYPNQAIRLGDVQLEIRRHRVTTQPGVSLAPTQATIRKLVPDEVLAERRYAIGGVVAQGGMGAILSAEQSAMKRNVAMKVMLDNAGETDVFRFVEEAQITGQLAHPNIVPVYELGVDENEQLYYTMKLVRGITLRKVLELLQQGIAGTIRKYPLTALLTIFQKVCDALAFAHSKGVLHRDLKPENIMLDDFGVVLVMDWGLAKVIGAREKAPNSTVAMRSLIISPRTTHGDSSQTLMGTVLGTPAYMSPEQARGEIDTLDVRSDVYALGAILFHMLALHGPVAESDDAMEMVTRVLEGEVEPLVAPKPGKLSHLPAGRIPDSLAAVVHKAMAFDKTVRYPDVAELQRDLEAYQNGFATSAEKAGTGKQLLLTMRRHKGVTTSIAAAVLILIGVVAAFTTKVMRERNRAEQALTELQRAAPSLVAEGRKLADEQQFDSALEKINLAVTIDPKNAETRMLHAQVLETLRKLREAAAEFREVLVLNPDGPMRDSAQTNLALCNQLLAQYRNPEALDFGALQLLYNQFRREGRNAQALPLAAALGRSRDTLTAVVENKLQEWRQLPGWPAIPESQRVIPNSDGTYTLSFANMPMAQAPALGGIPVSSLRLDNTSVSDLSPLAGLPLNALNVYQCRISDLSPLRGMPLHALQMNANPELRDLTPLRGLPLRVVSLSDTAVEDFSPLADSPLQDLTIDRYHGSSLDSLAGASLARFSAVGSQTLANIAGLRKMPLRMADLRGCSQLRDFAPLLDCPRLEFVGVPENVREVSVLRTHPRLWRISASYSSSNVWPPIEQYLDEVATDFHPTAESGKLLAQAHAACLAPGNNSPDGDIAVLGRNVLHLSLTGPQLKRLPDFHGLPVSWLAFGASPASDISTLSGLPLVGLAIDGQHELSNLAPLAQCKALRFLSVMNCTKVSDLKPLQGLSLTRLLIDNNFVSDLGPLRDMPLRMLSIRSSKVRDLAPLAEMTELSDLAVSSTPVVDLRPLKKLKLMRLVAGTTAIEDITPLAGMPLRDLHLDKTKVHDLRPLLECPDLEELTIPQDGTNVAVLRNHPKLKRLSYDYDGTYNGPSMTVEEFWKQYDATHPTQ